MYSNCYTFTLYISNRVNKTWTNIIILTEHAMNDKQLLDTKLDGYSDGISIYSKDNPAQVRGISTHCPESIFIVAMASIRTKKIICTF